MDSPGEEIPLASRIVFACDAVTAMRADRPYRRGLSFAETLAELDRCAGSQFDPTVARVLAAVLRDRGEGVRETDAESWHER